MARIIYSALATEIRGSVGGTTFQKNAYGFTVKNKPNMIKPLSPGQDRTKRFLLAMVQVWQLLDDATRTTWSTFASTYPQFSKHNPSAQLDGYGVFLRYNAELQLFNGFVQTDPGSHTTTLSPLDIIIKTDGEHVYAVVTASPDNFDIRYNCFVSRNVSNAVNFVSSRTRFMYDDILRSNTIDITSQYIATFGAPPVIGAKIFVRFVAFDTGGAFVYAPQNNSSLVEST